MKLTSLTIRQIKEQIITLPEMQEMKKAVEDNPWHNHQSVFDHTMLVVKNLEKYSRKKLLIIAALFHDIAKPQTLSVDPKTGFTTCVNHEEIGSTMIGDIGRRIGLKDKEIQYLEKIIANHGLTHEFVNSVVENGIDEPFAGRFFKTYGNLWKDLLFLALADTEGGELTVSDPEGFRIRKKIIERLLKI